MNPLIFPAISDIVSLLLYKDGFGLNWFTKFYIKERYVYMNIFFSSYNVWKHVSSSAPNHGDKTVSVAQSDTTTPGATKQLLSPDRVFKIDIYLYIRLIN